MTIDALIDALPPAPPTTADGFVRDFDARDIDGIRGFFDTYGFVAIRETLTDEARAATVDGVFRRAESFGLDPRDLGSLHRFFEHQRFGRFGIVGSFPEVFDLQQLRNRVTPAVYEAFCAVIGARELWVDHDRVGIMPPTRTADGQATGLKETERDWLHLDCHPLAGRTPGTGYASIGGFTDDGTSIDFTATLIIQGLLTLTDSPVEDGGFHCVPGSHRLCHAWVQDRQRRHAFDSRHIQVPLGDRIRDRLTEVAVRGGCLLAWTSLLFHGNHPNRSHRMRAVQYIRMVPNRGTPYTPLVFDPGGLPTDFERTPLADRLLGLRSWAE